MLKRLFGLGKKEESNWIPGHEGHKEKIHRELGLDPKVWEHSLAKNIYRSANRSHLSKESLDKLEILYKNGYAYVSSYGRNPDTGKGNHGSYFSVKTSLQSPSWVIIYFLMDSKTYSSIEQEVSTGKQKEHQDFLKRCREKEEERQKPIREFEQQFREKINTLA